MFLTNVYVLRRIRAGTAAATILRARFRTMAVAATISSKPKLGRGLNAFGADAHSTFSRKVAEIFVHDLTEQQNWKTVTLSMVRLYMGCSLRKPPL